MADPKIEGMERWKAKVGSRLSPALKAQMKADNGKSADEFMKLVARNIPRGDPKDGHLADSLKKEDATRSETGVAVSIGDAAHPYPMHLEGGHRTANGKHVPGKPFWNPAKRVLVKRHRSRSARGVNKVIKAMAGPT